MRQSELLREHKTECPIYIVQWGVSYFSIVCGLTAVPYVPQGAVLSSELRLNRREGLSHRPVTSLSSVYSNTCAKNVFMHTFIIIILYFWCDWKCHKLSHYRHRVVRNVFLQMNLHKEQKGGTLFATMTLLFKREEGVHTKQQEEQSQEKQWSKMTPAHETSWDHPHTRHAGQSWTQNKLLRAIQWHCLSVR